MHGYDPYGWQHRQRLKKMEEHISTPVPTDHPPTVEAFVFRAFTAPREIFPKNNTAVEDLADKVIKLNFPVRDNVVRVNTNIRAELEIEEAVSGWPLVHGIVLKELLQDDPFLVASCTPKDCLRRTFTWRLFINKFMESTRQTDFCVVNYKMCLRFKRSFVFLCIIFDKDRTLHMYIFILTACSCGSHRAR